MSRPGFKPGSTSLETDTKSLGHLGGHQKKENGDDSDDDDVYGDDEKEKKIKKLMMMIEEEDTDNGAEEEEKKEEEKCEEVEGEEKKISKDFFRFHFLRINIVGHSVALQFALCNIL